MEQTIPTAYRENPFSDLEKAQAPSLERLRHGLQDRLQRGRAYVHEHPEKVMLGSALAGFLMALLPLRPILRGVTRLLRLLAVPALLALGVQRVYEELRRSR